MTEGGGCLPPSKTYVETSTVPGDLPKQAEQPVQRPYEGIDRGPAVEKTRDTAQQIAEQAARTRLCRDLEDDRIRDRDRQAEQVEVQRTERQAEDLAISLRRSHHRRELGDQVARRVKNPPGNCQRAVLIEEVVDD